MLSCYSVNVLLWYQTGPIQWILLIGLWKKDVTPLLTLSSYVTNPSILSALWILMDLCYITMVSDVTVLRMHTCISSCLWVNTLRPRQNGRRFADDTFKCISLNENARISIKISLKFVPKGLVNNNPALVQIMAWRRSGDKPLSEPMMVSLLTHICVTRPQWVNAVAFQSKLHLLRQTKQMFFLQ